MRRKPRNVLPCGCLHLLARCFLPSALQRDGSPGFYIKNIIRHISRGLFFCVAVFVSLTSTFLFDDAWKRLFVCEHFREPRSHCKDEEHERTSQSFDFNQVFSSLHCLLRLILRSRRRRQNCCHVDCSVLKRSAKQFEMNFLWGKSFSCYAEFHILISCWRRHSRGVEIWLREF